MLNSTHFPPCSPHQLWPEGGFELAHFRATAAFLPPEILCFHTALVFLATCRSRDLSLYFCFQLPECSSEFYWERQSVTLKVKTVFRFLNNCRFRVKFCPTSEGPSWFHHRYFCHFLHRCDTQVSSFDLWSHAIVNVHVNTYVVPRSPRLNTRLCDCMSIFTYILGVCAPRTSELGHLCGRK